MKLNTHKIESELNRLGWSKYRLAVKMKRKHQWVYYVLSDNRNVTLRTIEVIANALELDPKDLII